MPARLNHLRDASNRDVGIDTTNARVIKFTAVVIKKPYTRTRGRRALFFCPLRLTYTSFHVRADNGRASCRSFFVFASMRKNDARLNICETHLHNGRVCECVSFHATVCYGKCRNLYRRTRSHRVGLVVCTTLTFD